MPPHHMRSHSPRFRNRGGPRNIYFYSDAPECYCDGYPCLCPPRDTGALERRNPLPAGIYSVDLANTQVPTFRNWQQGRSAVKVLKTNDDGEHSWILFSVSSPTVWATGIGFPEIAKASDEKPAAFEPTKNVLDQIADALPSPAAFMASSYFGVTIAAGLALYIYRKELFSNVSERIRKHRAARSR